MISENGSTSKISQAMATVFTIFRFVTIKMISLVFLLLYFKHLYEIFFKNFIGCAMGAW